MNLGLFLLTALAGGVGAGARYVLDLAATRWIGSRFPWGTLLINVTGSFVLGVVAASLSEGAVLTVVATGLLGGYTTFSSVATTSALLAVERRTAAAITNTALTLVLTVAAAALGLWLGGTL